MLKNAWNFILPAWALALAGALLARQGHLWGCALSSLALAAAAFFAWSFRAPARSAPEDGDALLAPADGRVESIEHVRDPWLGKAVEIRIQLGLLDARVQRSPFAAPALVEGTRYIAGGRLGSAAPQQHWARLSSGRRRAVVKQSAGPLSRRILPWCRPGDALEPIQPLGLAPAAAQASVIVGPEAVALAKVGDAVQAGRTVLARYKGRR